MARDRQRAKQRKQKRAPQPPSREGNDSAFPEPDALHRENVPGPFEHTGEIDQADAAIVAGADGEPADDLDAAERAAVGESELGESPGGDLPAVRHGEHAPASGRGGSRFLNFLRASWAELQRVQWPDRKQVGQATAVVLGFVVIAGAFLGLADVVAKEIVNFII